MLARSKKEGFLLVEVLVALVIFSFGIIFVVKAYSTSLRAQRHARYHTLALILAERLQEEIELGLVEDLKGEEEIAKKLFSWQIKTEPLSQEALKEAKVAVSWQERSKKYEVSFSRVYPSTLISEVLGENKGFYSY